METTSLAERECLRTDVQGKNRLEQRFWLVKKTHLGGETGGGGSGKGAAGGRQGLDGPCGVARRGWSWTGAGESGEGKRAGSQEFPQSEPGRKVQDGVKTLYLDPFFGISNPK